MKFHRLLAVLCIVAMCLLVGCGTSQETDSLMSVPEEGSWAVLDLPETTQTPEPEMVTPEIDRAEVLEDEGVDVTGQYMDVVLGCWDNEKKSHTYEFKSNENLTITKNSTGAAENYTYWFSEVSHQVRLYLYANGEETATGYSFTLSGSNMTLYDLTTGDAVELLTRKTAVAAAPVEPAAPTAAAVPTPAPTPTAVPTEAPTPTPPPEAEPSPTPSEEVQPSPSPVVELPAYVSGAIPAVECILDVMLDGMPYDAADSGAFWNIMARYLSLSHESEADDYITVSEARVLEFAKQVFPNMTDISQIPACPQDSNLVELLPADNEVETRYHIRWGAAGGHEMEVLSYENGTLVVQLDGIGSYGIVINEDGTVESAGPVA